MKIPIAIKIILAACSVVLVQISLPVLFGYFRPDLPTETTSVVSLITALALTFCWVAFFGLTLDRERLPMFIIGFLGVAFFMFAFPEILQFVFEDFPEEQAQTTAGFATLGFGFIYALYYGVRMDPDTAKEILAEVLGAKPREVEEVPLWLAMDRIRPNMREVEAVLNRLVEEKGLSRPGLEKIEIAASMLEYEINRIKENVF